MQVILIRGSIFCTHVTVFSLFLLR